MSHNAITDLSGLEENTSLRVLDFSNNQVSKLEHLSHLKNLEELWASNNQLSSFDEVERELRDKENLQTVYFEGNPLQTRAPALYRNKVRLAIPHIMQVDASKSYRLYLLMLTEILTKTKCSVYPRRVREQPMFIFSIPSSSSITTYLPTYLPTLLELQ